LGREVALTKRLRIGVNSPGPFDLNKKATGFARGKPAACLKLELPFGLALTL